MIFGGEKSIELNSGEVQVVYEDEREIYHPLNQYSRVLNLTNDKR
jgi:hypothetical protein